MTSEQKIKAFICTHLAPDIDPATLPVGIDLLATGIVDSLSLVRLIVWIEEEYDIPMGDIDIAPDDFRSIELICTFIEQQTNLGFA